MSVAVLQALTPIDLALLILKALPVGLVVSAVVCLEGLHAGPSVNDVPTATRGTVKGFSALRDGRHPLCSLGNRSMNDSVLQVVELQARRAIEPISFSLARSERIVLHSPPGLGKSYPLTLACGTPRASFETEVSIFGKDIHELEASDLDTLRLKMGYLPGEGQLMSNLGLFDNLVLPFRYHTDLTDTAIKGRAEEVLPWVGLDYILGPLADRREKRLVAIARTLILSPDLLLSDEPADGMDPEHADELWRNLRFPQQVPRHRHGYRHQSPCPRSRYSKPNNSC